MTDEKTKVRPAAETVRSRRLMLRFLVPLVILVTLASLGVRTAWFDNTILLPYTSLIASWSAGIANVFGADAKAVGAKIVSPTFAVSIRKGCDGLEATLLLVCASLAFPFSSWRSRAGAIITGLLLVFILNLIRVVALFMIGQRASYATFEFVHLYVAQFAIVVAVVLLWLYWISRDSRTMRAAMTEEAKA